ncbi:MAG: glycosyltransferase [Opitutaceae bacterium]|nr:glycosyltransferase [Opitutaceae bacterium]
MPPIAQPAAPAGLPQPRVLLFFLSHQDGYRKPLFSRHEVFCGPDTDLRVAATRTFALRAPVGSYDVGEILRQVPAEQQPEIVIVKADATRRNFPRNLARLKCPKILLVGDTHHLDAPLQALIGYAREELFDFIVFDHTRHHAHWFAKAGLRNLYWLPAVDYGFTPRDLCPAPTRPLTFVGQVGWHHPYRRAVLEQVRAAGLPLALLRGRLQETADYYADSQVTLNVSLNGDLNLRVFEALSAGGFLLTDELSEQSGLRLLFESGRHLDTWRTPGELIEKIRHYLAHPAEAQRIRAAGQAEIVRAHHPEVKLREFYDLIFKGRVNPRYDLGLDPRIAMTLPPADTGPVAGEGALRDLPAYETLQELHRRGGQVTVYVPAAELETLSALADLPRLRFEPHAALAAIEPEVSTGPEMPVLWVDEATPDVPALLAQFPGAHVLASPSSSELLAAWGFEARAPREAAPTLFIRRQTGRFLQQAWQAGAVELVRRLLPGLVAGAQDAADCVAYAEYADRLQDAALYRRALERAVSLDRHCAPALLQLAALALDAGDQASVLILLEEAARIAPLPPGVDPLRHELAQQCAGEATVRQYLVITHRAPVPPVDRARRILLVTNLFPPQELGGYGRMMWEFAQGLRARGHAVKVLAGQAGYLRKPATPDEAEMESCVSRALDLLGSWRHGRSRIEPNARKVAAMAGSNARKAVDAVRKFQADVVLLGNLDFLGAQLLQAVLAAGHPVLHAVANAVPGYAPAEQPRSPRYWVAPCSHWNGQALRQAGFAPARMETLYPGARLDRFYRMFLPDTGRLRVAYASLVLPYKGAHVLVDALARLHQQGLDFTAEIAGDTTDPAFVANLQDFCRQAGMDGKVSFPGFLDRAGLAALFARSNVLVFPSQFPEPFGISQVEAMAAGLVVVSSGTGGACEVVRDERDGLLFKAEDVDALAARLTALATRPELFARLQRQGQLRALDFSTDGAVCRIEGLVEELLASRVESSAA